MKLLTHGRCASVALKSLPFMTQMPGLQQLRHKNSTIQVLPPTSFCERSVRNIWIGRYFFANVDDYMESQDVPIDAAWLDYTGPLTIKRLDIIVRFFCRIVRHVLVVTALKARWNRETTYAIDRAGSYSSWLRGAMSGSTLHEIDYQDGSSPMSQIAFKKEAV